MNLFRTALFASALASIVSASAAGAATESVVYSFQNNGKDGVSPKANLTALNGMLYGTTSAGGTGSCRNGCGTIFSVNPATGAEVVLHSFSDVERTAPSPGALVRAGRELLGTTLVGGRREAGTIYSLNPASGIFKGRYYFCNLYNCEDGEAPSSGLLDSKGTLYGTTANGGEQCGQSGCGTVFSFDPKTRAETVLYAFCANSGNENCPDGAYPAAGLLNIKGTLYGTTKLGGTNSSSDCNGPGQGCGTVFSLDPASGAESVIYSFCSQQDCADGALPLANLINLNQVLYGTTAAGGDSANEGAVFAIDLSTGTETSLHSFQGGTDGIGPVGGLVDVNGKLYGVTVAGGGNGCADGCGTVYSIDPKTGTETIVYSFCSQQDCADGTLPETGLLNVNGTLYGVTSMGGSGDCGNDGQFFGCGTVFAITP